MLEMVDYYGGTVTILALASVEVIAINWIYGTSVLTRDFNFMLQVVQYNLQCIYIKGVNKMLRNLIFLEEAKTPSLHLGMLVSNNAPNCLDAAVCVLAVLLGAAVPRAAPPPLPVRGVHPGRGP